MPANTKKPVEVRPGKSASGAWEVARQGATRAISTHPTQQAAVQAAKPLAKKDHTEFILKGRDGQIRDRSSYGSDPRGRG